MTVVYRDEHFTIDFSDSVDVDKVVNECPFCHYTVKPEYILHNAISHKENETHYEVLYGCPRLECEHLFIALYKFEGYHDVSVKNNCEFLGYQVQKKVIDQRIEKISPKFVDIFKQSLVAEQNGLDKICGMGYRKALEFLTKDYLIDANKDDIDIIKRKPLSQCINDYEIDARIKSTAIRATWLGNDEAHYERRWEKEDIDSLRTLIELTMHWIIMEISTKEFEERMKKMSR